MQAADVHPRLRLLPLLDDPGLPQPGPLPGHRAAAGRTAHEPDAQSRPHHDGLGVGGGLAAGAAADLRLPRAEAPADRVLPVHVHELFPGECGRGSG